MMQPGCGSKRPAGDNRLIWTAAAQMTSGCGATWSSYRPASRGPSTLDADRRFPPDEAWLDTSPLDGTRDHDFSFGCPAVSPNLVWRRWRSLDYPCCSPRQAGCCRAHPEEHAPVPWLS